MYISSRVHLQESWYKVAVCIYHQVIIGRKVDIKLPYVYIIRCSSAGKLISSYRMYISSGVHRQESWCKVAVYIYIITCSSARNLIKSCSMYISSRVHLQKSWYKVTLCIYHHVYISSRVHLQENWYKVAVCIYHQIIIGRKLDIKLRYVYIIRCSSPWKLI